MSQDFDLFGREILAYLALHPGGVELHKVRQHTERQVRAKKSFDAKFARSMATVLNKAPYQTHTADGAEIIASRTIAPRADGPAPPTNLYAQVRQAILDCLVPAGNAQRIDDLRGCVQGRLGQDSIGLGDMFEATFRGALDLLGSAPEPQLEKGKAADGTRTYRRVS